jgi:hypothetical protein
MSKCPACQTENPSSAETCNLCGCYLVPIVIEINADVHHPLNSININHPEMCSTCGSTSNLEQKTYPITEVKQASVMLTAPATYAWPYYECGDCKKMSNAIYLTSLHPDRLPKEKRSGRIFTLFNISLVMVVCLLPILLGVAYQTKLWAICWSAVPIILFSIIVNQIRESKMKKYGQQEVLPGLVKELGHSYHPFMPDVVSFSAYKLKLDIYCHEYATSLLNMNPLSITRL